MRSSISHSSSHSSSSNLSERFRSPFVAFTGGLLLGILVVGDLRQQIYGTTSRLTGNHENCKTFPGINTKGSSSSSSFSSSSSTTVALVPSTNGAEPWIDPPLPLLQIPSCNPGVTEWPTFLDVLYYSDTDKGPTERSKGQYSHLYHVAYQKYFSPYRSSQVKLLEIGIGCKQRYVGASIPIWRSYFPCVHLSMFEYERACAEKYRSQIDELFIGDQSKPKDLEQAIKKGPYHLMVDDGGHTHNQQIVSLRTLFPTLPPGGIYVLEDMQTSVINDPNYYDLPNGITTHKFISDVIEQLHRRTSNPATIEGSGEIARLALNVDCIREACIFVRNAEPATSTTV